MIIWKNNKIQKKDSKYGLNNIYIRIKVTHTIFTKLEDEFSLLYIIIKILCNILVVDFF